MALAENGRVVTGRSWRSAVSHSSELMPAVAQVLHSREVSPRSLDAVAVALGPGGFSALRTGLSVAKGMALAAGIPIIGIGSLDLEAYPFRDAGVNVCALLEAGRGEVSSSLFSPAARLSRLREDRITGPDVLLDEICALGERSTLFCGDGLGPWTELVKLRLAERAILCQAPASGRAESLAALAFDRLGRGETDDLDSLQPTYLRMPSIGAPKRRDRNRQASSRGPLPSQRGQ